MKSMQFYLFELKITFRPLVGSGMQVRLKLSRRWRHLQANDINFSYVVTLCPMPYGMKLVKPNNFSLDHR